MADMKKKPKKPVKPFIGYGTDVAAGKKITKSVKKTVAKKVAANADRKRETFSPLGKVSVAEMLRRDAMKKKKK